MGKGGGHTTPAAVSYQLGEGPASDVTSRKERCDVLSPLGAVLWVSISTYGSGFS